MTINERILALRRAAGLSQEALAEQVGVSRQAIGKWESGASLPGLDNLQELARALGVSCDELLTGKESGTENTAGQDGVALESVKALLDAQNAAQAHAAHRQRILLAGLAAALACVGAALVYLGVYYGAACGSFPAVWTTSAQTWPASKAASICVSHPSSPA
ncbi:MAG: helix-turn-helix domain-containing protein [Ruthenibacterium lactatiformans]